MSWKHARTAQEDEQEDKEIGLILARVRQGLDEVEKRLWQQAAKIHQYELRFQGQPAAPPNAGDTVKQQDAP